MTFAFTAASLEPGRYEPEGVYLSPPCQGLPVVTQLWGENPDFYRQFLYNGVPLQGHNGIDFGAALGSTIQAVEQGEVAFVGFEAGGFGLYVKLLHRWGESLYAHMGQAAVTTGQRVSRGQSLGLSGNSGASSGPHLHFGIRIFPFVRTDGWGGFTDPQPYLDPQSLTLPRSTRPSVPELPGMVVERPGMRRP